jgi:hypothetical protein
MPQTHPLALPLTIRFLPILLLAPATIAAQSTSRDSASNRPRPTATAAARLGPVKLDGRLEDAAWAAATPITEFTQQKPIEGAPPTERTQVRILYDDAALYIGARMYDSHGAAGVTSRLTRRDDTPQSDILRIDLDPYHDRLHSFEFDVNPAGWRGDANGNDRSWDPVWEAASQVDSLGWTTEIRIPFSQLRFSRDSVQIWGLNLTRITDRNQERDMWSFWQQKDAGGPAYFGDLTGLTIGRGSRHGEMLPYFAARAQRLGTGDPMSPFYAPHTQDLRIGGDLKYLVTSNVTLSATANPDFGQVEVDPAVVNLSAYETFFPEKRPFFVEGSDVFQFGMPGCNINCGLGLDLFYSRRIGRAPQGAGLAYADGDFADVPVEAAILGAAKLTGRTRSGFTVGLMDAVTDREVAKVASADGSRFRQPVEPLTNSLVVRAKRELKDGNLVIGGLFTSVERHITDPGLVTLLPQSAQTGGVDAEAFWAKHTYRFYAAISASRVAGDSLAILRVQRSPAHYFQRPDRARIPDRLFSSRYDSSATGLTGSGFIARLAKQGGNWLWDLNAASVSPGFEANDLGFVQRADYRWVNGSFGRQYTKPTGAYQNLEWIVGAEQYWNYDDDNTGRDATAYLTVELPNFWRVSTLLMRNFASLDDLLTRGGPVVAVAPSTRGFLSVSTDPRRSVVLNTTVNLSRSDDGGHGASLDLSATIKPASNVTLSVGPGYSTSTTTAQYVTAIEDPTATAFFGSRYVFAHLDERQLYMNTRASVTFTPSLSLELFAQPLLASGDYHDFEEFAAPRQLRKLVYGRDVGEIVADGGSGYFVDPDGPGPSPSFTVANPNFNLRSLRGTGVLRWEWRPGSSAYLVWTQTRTGTAPLGDLDFNRDRKALFAEPADNILVFKVSYWLGL